MDKQKVETVSSRLMEVCVTIAEMFEIALIFPRKVKAEISKTEQRVGFTIEPD